MAEEKKKSKGRPPVANPKRQYTLTMRPDLYEKAQREADRRGISFSAFVSTLLTDFLDAKGVNNDRKDGRQ